MPKQSLKRSFSSLQLAETNSTPRAQHCRLLLHHFATFQFFAFLCTEPKVSLCRTVSGDALERADLSSINIISPIFRSFFRSFSDRRPKHGRSHQIYQSMERETEKLQLQSTLGGNDALSFFLWVLVNTQKLKKKNLFLCAHS